MPSSSTPKNRFPPSRSIDSWPFRYRFASRTMYPRSQFLNQAVCGHDDHRGRHADDQRQHEDQRVNEPSHGQLAIADFRFQMS